ncbi:MAG: hypothetical protein ACLSUW_03315 [Akkermansia sp.]
MALIVCGGLGFGIYKEINSRWQTAFPNTAPHAVDPYSTGDDLHGILLAGGALAIFAVSSPHAAEPWGITSGIAFRQRHGAHGGFNISDYGRYLPAPASILRSDDGRGSPGTAGGMRTTTALQGGNRASYAAGIM